MTEAAQTGPRSGAATVRRIPYLYSLSSQYIAEGSYVGWAAILAGGVFVLAISFLLIEFGASLGLSLTSPYRGEGVSAAWLVIAAGIWFGWVMVFSIRLMPDGSCRLFGLIEETQGLMADPAAR